MEDLILFGHSANDDLLYQILLEFIEKDALSQDFTTIAAVLCEKDQNKFGKYIESDSFTEILMVNELESGVYDSIKEEYDQNKIVWVDPREL